MNETEKIIKEQLNKLPANLRKAILTVPWEISVEKIGKANNLDEKQITSLERETLFVLCGFEQPEDYIENIMREVGIPEEMTYKIAETVNEKVFGPITDNSREADTISSMILEIGPEIHPMIEKGEVAHEVPHAELVQPARQGLAGSGLAGSPGPKNVSLPDYRYPGGKDPYREPLK
jgi:hypothetical protein